MRNAGGHIPVWRLLAAELIGVAARAGVPGVIGLGLIMFAIAWAWTGHTELRARTERADESRRALQAQLRQPASARISPRDQLDGFYRDFPAQSSLPDVLLALHQQARKQGLSPLKAAYRESAETATPLIRVRVEIPVRGSYPAVRNWLAEVSRQMPQLGIEAIEMRRNDINQTELETTARFVVFLRGRS